VSCSSCGHENRAGRKFCVHCGTGLELVCPSCGASLEPGERFCGECGRSLAEPQKPTAASEPRAYTPKHLVDRILAEQAAMEARGAVEGERKTITALFADIKGSVELIEALDPEEARGIVDPALQIMMDAVHRYEGYVAQSRGDGILGLFGAPLAHEDHPRRALLAAMRMQDEMKRYAEQLRRDKGVTLEIRVGINTGQVVVRSIRKDDLHTDYVPIGHSTNLAARLESLAAPGSILVSEETRKLTEGYFDFRSLGAAHVKGVSDAVELHQLTGLGALQTKLEVSARRGLVPFVGRQSEMMQLRHAFDLAKSGRGQIVGTMGEPGVGKSRLVHEFKQFAKDNCLLLDAFAVSHAKNHPYLPLIELLKDYFGIAAWDDETRRREKIAAKVTALDRSLDDAVPYVFFLFGLLEAAAPLHQMDAQIRRQRTFDAVKRLLLRETRNQPLLLVFEDLHWIDAETQAFLELLGEGLATARLLLIGTYRPEYEVRWTKKSYFSQLRLDPLERQSAEEMLTAMLGEETDLGPLKRLILDKAEGTPFFMEEIVQGLFERGVLKRNGRVTITSPLAEIRIPSTVESVLAARVDRLLPAEKELLQVASVIGRQFSPILLAKSAGRSQEETQGLLARLQGAEFVYEQPALSETGFIFKHALTRDVAYNSLVLQKRRDLHERTAQGIEGLYAARPEEHYFELADHYGRSGNNKKAVEYLTLAGQQAVERSALTEAILHLNTALELLATLPDSQDRRGQELTLLVLLGAPLMATKGYGVPEVEKLYARARELCQQVGETPQLFPVLWGLCVFYEIRAEFHTARELGEQLLTLAQRVRDPALIVEARYVLGETLFFLGEIAPAREHLEQAITLYDRRQHGSLVSLYGGIDPGVACRGDVASALWFLGYPDQALKRMHEGLTLAQELAHPCSSSVALCLAAWVSQYRRDGRATQEQAEASITVSREQGFPFWLTMATMFHGWALAERGHGEEGIAEMRQSLAAFRATGSEFVTSYYLALLAEAYGKTGQAEEGLRTLAEALEVANKTGGREYEAELYRLKGELSLQSRVVPISHRKSGSKSAETEAEKCFLKAIDIARRQSAKSLELRASTSLSRLFQQQGKTAEARQTLSDIYGWFTEGFDTADLKDAKALLDELS